MAYRIEGTDIVWDGFEKGISDDPYTGLADMVGMNIVSIPGEGAVSFSPSANTSTLTGSVVSADAGTDVITATISTGAITNYQAVTFTGASLPAGIVAGTIYWVNFQSGTTFKVYTDCYLTNVLNITGTGTGTFASIDIGEVKYMEKTLGYCVDANGRVWSPVIDSSSGTAIVRYTFMNNTTTNNTGNGLVVFKGTGTTKYLFVFRNAQIDYTTCADTLGIFTGTGSVESGIIPSWQNNWKTLNTGSSVPNPHEAVIDPSNKVFWTDSYFVGSLRELPSTTFDPTNSATYEFNSTAFAIPTTEIGMCIEQLGDRILIGGLYNFVYVWDRIATGGTSIQVAEKGISKLLTVNASTYIFAGKRGRIFITNGSQAGLFKKLPDHLLGLDPVITFKGVAYNKNQIYFGVTSTDNASTTSTAFSGLWAIDIDTKALRRPVLCSTTTADVVSIFAMPSSALGYSLLTAWKSGSTYGIDSTLSTPYTTYVPYVITDMTPVGLYLKKKTFQNIEFKLSAPLVADEGVYIYQRKNLSDSFTAVGEYTTAGDISGIIPINFENSQWLQLKVFTKSKTSSPSFTRLREIRIR